MTRKVKSRITIDKSKNYQQIKHKENIIHVIVEQVDKPAKVARKQGPKAFDAIKKGGRAVTKSAKKGGKAVTKSAKKGGRSAQKQATQIRDSV